MTVEQWIQEEAEIAAEAAEKKGREEGREEGEMERLISLVAKKVGRNKSFSTIVDELESDESEIRPIYDAVIQYGHELSPGEIRVKMVTESIQS